MPPFGAIQTSFGPLRYLPSIIRDEHGHGFVRRDGPELIVFVGAGDQISFRVKHHSVRVAGRLHERGKFSIRAPFHDAVIRLVNEKHVSLLVAGRAFGERKIARKFLKFRAGRDDAFGETPGSKRSTMPAAKIWRNCFHVVRKICNVAVGESTKNAPCFCRAKWGNLGADFRANHASRNKKNLLRFLQSWLINTLAVLVAVIILRGHVTSATSSPI